MEHENTLRSEARSDSFSQSQGTFISPHDRTFLPVSPITVTVFEDFYGSKIGEGGGEGRRRG